MIYIYRYIACEEINSELIAIFVSILIIISFWRIMKEVALSKVLENNPIRTNPSHSEQIQKMFCISFDVNQLKINPNESEVGFIRIENLVWIHSDRTGMNRIKKSIGFWSICMEQDS